MGSIQNFEERFNTSWRLHFNSLYAIGAMTDSGALLHKTVFIRVPCKFCQLEKFSNTLKSSLIAEFPFFLRDVFTNQVPICSSQPARFVSNASIMYNSKLFLSHRREKILQSD